MKCFEFRFSSFFTGVKKMKIGILFILLWLSICLSGCLFSKGESILKKSVSENNSGRFDNAAKLAFEACEKNNARACYLAVGYSNRKNKDDSESYDKYLKKAERLGDISAKYILFSSKETSQKKETNYSLH